MNKKPVFMYERLTKQASDLLDYARGLGMRTTSKNSQPQVLIKTKNLVRPHNLLNEKDADEVFESGNAVVQQQQFVIAKTPVAFQRVTSNLRICKPKTQSPQNNDCLKVCSKLKELRQQSDAKGLNDFIAGISDDSPPKKMVDNSCHSERSLSIAASQ